MRMTIGSVQYSVQHTPFRPIRLLASGAVALLLTAACQGELAVEPNIAAPSFSSMGATGMFVDAEPPAPFGKFGGQDYVRLTGRFVGTTAQGAFRVPYEIVVPEHSGVGNGTVLIEPPHFGQLFAARDDYLGHEFLFGSGYRYASVGWSTFANSILDPTATDVFIAGGQDDEIVVQFIHALKSDPAAKDILGPVERYYGYGFSQTSWLMHRILRSPAGPGLLDFTMLNATWWQGGGFQGAYTPVTGVGKVVIVQTEADIVIADGEVIRAAAAQPNDYRVYEVAGSAHIPDVPSNHDNPVFGPFIIGTNPVDWPAVARAAFVTGDEWFREGTPAPPSVFIAEDAPGAVDPVYGFPTGIARDADLNALGGVRLPDVELGRSRFMAADGNVPIAFLTGSFVDLACTPNADGSVRFPNHGEYVSASGHLLRALSGDRLLLQEDVARMQQAAAESEVGKPKGCSN